MSSYRDGVRTLLTYIAAAWLLATVNAVTVYLRLSEAVRPITRWGVHFYELCLFGLFGLLCGFVEWSWLTLVEKRPDLGRTGGRVLSHALLGALLGALLVTKDFANFASRQDLPVAPVWLGMLTGTVTTLALALLRRVLQRRWLATWAGCLGLGLGYANGSVLQGNYPGFHFLALLVALLLLSIPLRGRVLRLPAGIVKTGFVLTVLLALAPWALSPSRAIRQNLTVSSGSAITPFVLPYVPQRLVLIGKRLEIEQSEWFQSRAKAADVPATPGTVLPPNGAVILLTVEALRADVVSSRKHDEQLPNLARLRDEGLFFVNARTPTPSTLTTVTSLFAGKYYSQIYFTEHQPGHVDPITDRSVRFPELLSDAGVWTVHARAVHGLGSDFGVGRGFDEEPATPKDYGRAKDLMNLVLDQLETLETDPERRLFVYGHFVDSHAPYNLGGKRATPFEGYLAELELIDHELGRLLKYLKEHSLDSRCLLVVTADHGEAFGEHGMRHHALSVYEELLRIPLVVRHPQVRPGTVKTEITLLDLSSTLLDLFGLPTPGGFMGQSLKPLLLGHSVVFTRPIAADSGRRRQAFLFKDGIKVIHDLPTDTVQVFDLKRDKKEKFDLTDSTRDVEPYIRATVDFFKEHTLHIDGWEPPWRTF